MLTHMALFHYKKEIVMEDYKNIIEKLKDDERFVEIVQETLNERTSK